MLQVDVHSFQVWTGPAETYPDTKVAVEEYPNTNLYIQPITALQTIAPFIGAAEPFHVFVYLDNTTLVPYQTAALLSACFHKGLLTRLLLEKYQSNWSKIVQVPVPAINLQLQTAPPVVFPGPSPVPQFQPYQHY
jgi:hypothetical protein